MGKQSLGGREMNKTSPNLSLRVRSLLTPEQLNLLSAFFWRSRFNGRGGFFFLLWKVNKFGAFYCVEIGKGLPF
ncbi:hypothetical protein ACFX2B_024065 [Malus domestica]